jgi:hypothetical protein
MKNAIGQRVPLRRLELFCGRLAQAILFFLLIPFVCTAITAMGPDRDWRAMIDETDSMTSLPTLC